MSFRVIFLFIIIFVGEYIGECKRNRRKRDIFTRILNPKRKELNKSGFNGKFKETFNDVKIIKKDNELSKELMNKGQMLRDEIRDKIRDSRFKFGNPKQIAKDLSWIQVDKYGNQNEYDLTEHDINNLVNNIQDEMHSRVYNSNDKDEVAFVNERRRTYVMEPDDRIRINRKWRSPPKHVGLIKFRSANGGNRGGGSFGSFLDFGNWYRSSTRGNSKSWQQCTGTLIGPRHVLTAGHCVHEGSGGDWYSEFRFYLDASDDDDDDDEDNYYGWNDIRAVSCWTNNGDFNCDFGIIILDREPRIGYMPIGYNNDVTSNMWFIAFGYPTRTNNQMWLTGCTLWEVNDDNFRDTSCDIEPGQSGSALSTWVESLNSRIIYGIVSNENYIQTSNGWYSNKVYFNQHTRITPYVYSILCDWIQNDGYYDVCQYYY